MENQEELNIGIGTKEPETLEPATVKIVEVRVEVVGKKNSKKVICDCKHPAQDNTIQIGAVKYEVKGKLDAVGLWVNKDKDGLLQKGSALVYFLNSVGAKVIAELKDKEVMTVKDEKGYLCFKAY